MFWKFGGYANISSIDAILDRPDFTLEELLDESDLLGDIKAHNSKLLEYLRRRDVLERLLDLVVAPKLAPVTPTETLETEKPAADADAERGRPRRLPFGRSRGSSFATDGGGPDEEDEAEKKRNKYAFVACEVLSSDNWSICEALMDVSNRDFLRRFWQFLKQPTPLDPLQAGYFTKVNESLFDRKVEEMVDFLKSADNAVQDMVRHVDCPMIMDLLLKIITLDRLDACQGLVEWLYTQNLMPTLLSFLNPENSWATQTSAGDFIKAIITVSANATQNEQTCIGPNELTRQLVSHPCIDDLIGYMLKGGNALTVGVGIVIEVIRKNNSDYDPDVGTEANSIPSSRDPIYLGTLLRMFAQNVPNFMQLMNNAPAQKARLDSTFDKKIEPFGFDRFKTCELMAELLHCSNMGLLNEVGSEALILARDTERKRLRSEGKLTPNRGEEATTYNADLLTMRIAHTSPADEGRRLEVTNVSPADDGFEEVTHTAGLGEDNHQEIEPVPLPPRQAALLAGESAPVPQSFLDKDGDDFVEEPLSSPRLKTHDGAASNDDEVRFDDPDMLVAPLSPSKNKVAPVATPSAEASENEASIPSELAPGIQEAEGALKDEQADSSDDFVTEATEPALGDEAKRMVPDLEKGDDSDSSIFFTPTISTLSESFSALSPQPSQSSAAEAAHDVLKPAIVAVPLAPQTETDGAAQEEPQPSTETEIEAGASAEQKQEKLVANDEAGNDEHENEAGDASIIVAQPLTEKTRNEPTADTRFVNPVVGDYLKMQFVDHRVVPTILSFFFAYPWNNFLHNVVYDVVQQVFNGPMERGFNPHLANFLFESADITTQIINGQLVSEQSQAATKMRMGYMGHLTLIAEEVVKFTERNPPELLPEAVLDKVMSPDWINYVEGPLAETRERDNAILGGVRPDVTMTVNAAGEGLAGVGLAGVGSSLGMSNSQGTSSALADAGLNGGLDLHGGFDLPGGNDGGGGGPFSISAGISSGFHSSSDEEDDDADDNDEDINTEGSFLGSDYGNVDFFPRNVFHGKKDNFHNEAFVYDQDKRDAPVGRTGVQDIGGEQGDIRHVQSARPPSSVPDDEEVARLFLTNAAVAEPVYPDKSFSDRLGKGSGSVVDDGDGEYDALVDCPEKASEAAHLRGHGSSDILQKLKDSVAQHFRRHH
ncbi:sit4-associated protein [Niveomyces insectorum RCEF 264]|uniref:Sit4-associated protein n=1 Tax=Niveomyces insectorum RCEF 264 TaxID=1081102 RepID=A0A167QUR0_9HYPO|nr:sit4-associated protein [Niveomyces insectorum RCEF 264]